MHRFLIATSLLASAAHAEISPAEGIADERLHLVTRGNLVATDDLAPKGVVLEAAEDTYSFAPAVAAAPPLAHARAVTLVGPNGHCELATTKRVFTSIGRGDRPIVALELDPSACKLDRVVLAIDGKTDATAELMTGRQSASAITSAWVERVTGEKLGPTWDHKDKTAFRELVPGTKAAVIYAYYEGGGREMLVERAGRLLGRFSDATAVSVLHDHGNRLVITTSSGMRTIAL